MIPRQAGRGLTAAVALLLTAGTASGQVEPKDSLAAADSIPLRVERQDSVPPAAPPAVAPIPSVEIPPGPLSPGSRLVFSRDSILWTNGYTLADLLVEIPGTYAARAGFAGQPTPVHYGGRGTAGIEILYDGLPVTAVGPDSLAVDPGRISLIGLRRVEVERHPSFLRVYLVSERSERPGARSLLRIVNGDFKTAGYAGLFQYRWRSGVGLDVTADYFNAQGGQGTDRQARWFDLRAAADWTPSPLVSASFQLRSQTFDRKATQPVTGIGIPLREDTRSESIFRLIASTRPERQGLSFEAGVQSINWQADTASVDTVLGERSVHTGFAGVRLAGRRGSADLSVRATDYHTPLTAELRAGWTPLGWVALSGGGRAASHRGGRSSRSADVSLALYRGAFSLVGDARWADAVAAPVLADDTAQTTLDLGARLGFTTRWLTLHGGVEQRDAFSPPEFAGIPDLPPFGASPEATFLVSDLTLNFGPMTLSGWYANPLSGEAGSYEPPSHSRAALTFRSRFLRTFRSGAFDLKVQVAVESWGDGTAGVDANGAPVPLPGSSLVDAFLQFELASFHAFYSLKNALRAREGFVPGFEYPRNFQSFGVKWLFND